MRQETNHVALLLHRKAPFMRVESTFGSETRSQSVSGVSGGWRRGVVVSGVRRVNEVNAPLLLPSRLVPGWVTVFGRVYNLGM